MGEKEVSNFFEIVDCENLWKCFCCKMRMGTDDVCYYLNKHIASKIEEYEQLKDKNISFAFAGGSNRRYAGDLDLHMGIDIKFENKDTYYISFSSFNVDAGSKNIHIMPGRIQIMLGDGKPNTGVETVCGMCMHVFYPQMSEDRESKGDVTRLKLAHLKDNRAFIVESLKNGRKIFYTGYRLFGNNGTRDILLDESKYEEFMINILQFIDMVESMKIKNEI